jgi:hypothetical protein
MSIEKKSFTALGKIIKKSSDTVRRLLNSPEENFTIMRAIATEIFKNKKNLVLSIDETFSKKIYSQWMQGACQFFDTTMGKMITAYKIMAAGLSDGKYFVPIYNSFTFSKDVLENANELRNELIEKIILDTQKFFPDKTITFVLDGAFATKRFFRWVTQKGIRAETRMHSNRKIFYKGKLQKISEVTDLIPKGRHMARTISALWDNIPLYITAQRRINKRGEESIVYQASTYEAKPSEHVANYIKRWKIEKFNRTSKQHLGLQDCFSTKLETQEKHVSSVLLAYSLVQLEMRNQKIKVPEDAIRWLRTKTFDALKKKFIALDQIFGDTHA